MRTFAAALATTFAATAHAHGGHGIAQDVHWHATDAWGFLLVGVLAAVAIWLTRGGK
jgi:hypothetical protein